MLLPYCGEDSRCTDSNLHARPLVSQDFLRCLHPKEEITAPATFDVKDFVGNMLLALVLLVETRRSKTLDLKKLEKFCSKLITPESPRVTWLSISSERCKIWQYCCFSVFPNPTKWGFQKLEWWGSRLSNRLSCTVCERRVKGGAIHNQGYILRFLLRQEKGNDRSPEIPLGWRW